MANSQDRDVFSGIRQADALTRWEGLVRRFPSYLKSQMSYVDFQRAWRTDNRIPLDAWDTYCQAFDLDPRTGNKRHAEEKNEEDDHYWTEEKKKEDESEDKEIKTEGEEIEAAGKTRPEETDGGQDTKKEKQEAVRAEPVAQPNKPLTPDEIKRLNEEFGLAYKPPPPQPTGQLATPIRTQYPQASSVYGARTHDGEEADHSTGTTSRPLRRARRPRKSWEEKMLRKMLKPNAKNIAQAATRTGFLSSPAGWIIILLIILFITALFFILKSSPVNLGRGDNTDTGVGPVAPGGGDGGSGNVPGVPGLTLNKTVPSNEVGRDDSVTYTITAVYSGDLDVTIYDPVAQNADYVSSTPEGGQYDEVSRTRSWKLNEVTPLSTSGDTRTYVFTITLRPDEALRDAPKVTIANRAFATAAENPGAGGTPTKENCEGFYDLSNPIDSNFGDLQCELPDNEVKYKDDLYALLKHLDPPNADFWFNQVIRCESGYNPNTYYRNGAAGETPDEGGAWGLYQMGSEYGANLIPPQGNGPLDRGDVPWRQQTKNAIDYYYQQMDGANMGAYWACARQEFLYD